MKVLHLDLPRAFTMTVKEYGVDVERVLGQEGVQYSQYDTNPVFWRWLLDNDHGTDEGPLFDVLKDGVGSADTWHVLDKAQRHFGGLAEIYGVGLGLRGMEMTSEMRNSSVAMCAVLADGYGERFFDAFFTELNRRYGLLEVDVLSLGVAYPEGVFWALALAAWMKSRGGSAHIVIARHAYGNFSLVHQVDELMQTQLFFLLVDTVILYQEDLPDSMLELVRCLQGGAGAGCHNMVTHVRGELERLDVKPEAVSNTRETAKDYRIPPSYFESMGVSVEDIVYSIDLVRNKCFYKQCNFCTQIHHHVGDRAFEKGAEIERVFTALECLVQCGVGLVNFQDEAMSPHDLRLFCSGVLERGLTTSWVGRMITLSVVDSALLQMMRRAGCVEVLFGVETFDPGHARNLGKVSGRYTSADEIVAVIKSFLDVDLFVILSMIVDFPTETVAVRETNLRSLKGILAYSDHVGMYINHYELFKPSVVFDRPEQFGIKVKERSAHEDLRYHYGYEASRRGISMDETEQFDAVRFGLSVESWRKVQQCVGRQSLEDLYFFDYNSWGLVHRVKTCQTIAEGPIALLVSAGE